MIKGVDSTAGDLQMEDEISRLAGERVVCVCEKYIAVDVSGQLHNTYKKAFRAELNWIKNQIAEGVISDGTRCQGCFG